jgi:2-polyprenyl-6-methoxyphenol hydroxylase-like FAD-dependent oxidoreductase
VRALICGAGITGLTLARLLDAMGWHMDLVERAAGLRDEGVFDRLLRARL